MPTQVLLPIPKDVPYFTPIIHPPLTLITATSTELAVLRKISIRKSEDIPEEIHVNLYIFLRA